MNKKLIVLALVLLIAVGGLFAALPYAGDVTATLTGTIGSSFKHGFKVGNDLYQPSVNLTGDAFSTNPVLVYGFEAKNDTLFESKMTVSSFKKGTETVAIAKVIISIEGAEDAVYNEVTDSTEISVLKYTTANTMATQEASIEVVPGSTEGKPSGSYVSTLSIGIVATT
jgi:hypothetical protein